MVMLGGAIGENVKVRKVEVECKHPPKPIGRQPCQEEDWCLETCCRPAKGHEGQEPSSCEALQPFALMLNLWDHYGDELRWDATPKLTIADNIGLGFSRGPFDPSKIPRAAIIAPSGVSLSFGPYIVCNTLEH